MKQRLKLSLSKSKKKLAVAPKSTLKKRAHPLPTKLAAPRRNPQAAASLHRAVAATTIQSTMTPAKRKRPLCMRLAAPVNPAASLSLQRSQKVTIKSKMRQLRKMNLKKKLYKMRRIRRKVEREKGPVMQMMKRKRR